MQNNISIQEDSITYPCNTGYTKPFLPNFHTFGMISYGYQTLQNLLKKQTFYTFLHHFSYVVYTNFKGTSRGPEALQSLQNDSCYKIVLCFP